MKKITAYLSIALLSAVALSGCVRLTVDMTVHEDNTVDMVMVTAFDEALMDLGGAGTAGGASIFDQLNSDSDTQDGLKKLESAGATVVVEEYDEDGYTGAKFTITDMPLDAAAGEDPSGLGLEVGSITREGDYFLYYAPLAQTGQLEGANDTFDMLNNPLLAGSLDISISVTFPGKIVEASHGTVSGNTVTFGIDELTGGEDIYVKAKATSSFDFGAWLVPILLGLVLVGAAAFLVWQDRNVKAAKAKAQVAAVEAFASPAALTTGVAQVEAAAAPVAPVKKAAPKKATTPKAPATKAPAKKPAAKKAPGSK